MSSDVNQGWSTMDAALREFAMRAFQSRFPAAASDLPRPPVPVGFFGDAFKVRATSVPSASVNISAGLGFMDLLSGVVANGDAALISSLGAVGGLNDLHRYKPLFLSDVGNGVGVNIPVPPETAGLPRIDLVEVLVDRKRIEPASRDVWNGVDFVPGSVLKTLTWQPATGVTGDGLVTAPPSTTGIGYKLGIAAGVPVAPTVTPGYVAIAFVRWAALQATIVNAGGIGSPVGVVDVRRILGEYGMFPVQAILSMNLTTGVLTIVSVMAPPGVFVVGYGSAPFFGGFTVGIVAGALLQALITTTLLPAAVGVIMLNGPPVIAGLSQADHDLFLNSAGSAGSPVGIAVGSTVVQTASAISGGAGVQTIALQALIQM